MKNIYSKLVLVSLLIGSLSGVVNARECTECKKTNAKNAAVRTKAAACKRAQSTAELNINNVRALINGYGNMWYDGSVAQYHLPKNSNTSPLFCAALWIGGTDVNDQLRLAALRFGSDGDDYWPGPLKVNGTASIDLPVCNEYDRHWVITKTEVQALMSQFKYDTNGRVTDAPTTDISEYVTDAIANWPAHGNADDVSHYLAPFFDADGDGEYNPYAGDYPYYDFDNELCPRTIKAKNPGSNYVNVPTLEESSDPLLIHGSVLPDQVLKGDQTIWWIFNDMGNTHTESKGQPIGLEIRAQAFAFSTNDEINNMTFYSYEIINRSTYTLRETYFSQWVDADLGYAFDDFVGCDVRRGLGYCYNGDENDGPGSGSYAGIPPAVGIDFFQGPYMDPDGLDNPKIDIEYIENSGNGPLMQLLSNYRKTNGQPGYDTIALTDDADLFYAIDYNSWYFKKDDAVGNCAINGVNFGNNIIDDERFGMRRFVYYDNSTDLMRGEPVKAADYYNYLRGYWKNNQRMHYGGDGANSDGVTDIDADFMYPGDSDPWHWGTNGVDVPDWSENTRTSPNPGDRRFMQSAGPFTLEPGALNYITVGIPFAQAASGNSWSSVELLREIDDVCQALFENCFKVLDGPQAPTMTAQELDNEIILYLSYENEGSNNYKEKYREIDPSIVKSYTEVVDSVEVTRMYSDYQRSYVFEGYMIYQLADANASIADLGDATKARLVAQCDIENYYDTIASITTKYGRYVDNNGVREINWLSNIADTAASKGGYDVVGYDTTFNTNPQVPISTLVNFETNSATGLLTGSVKVAGANKGLQHVFRITNDAFATGTSTRLVNNREYYFVAIAYAQNRYKAYSQTDAAYLDGQKTPFLAGRQNEWRQTITPITVIPHSPYAENGGTMAQAEFGMSPTITRIEGHGNGGNILRLTQKSIESIMGAPYQAAVPAGEFFNNRSGNNDVSYMKNSPMIVHPEYEENYGPLNVRVIDPLQLKAGQYEIFFYNLDADRVVNTAHNDVEKITRWYMRAVGDTTRYWSDFAISRSNEQIFPELGVAISITNPISAGTDYYTDEQYGNDVNKSNIFANFSVSTGVFDGVSTSGALLGSEMVFADENQQWLTGIPDNDSYYYINWIRAGQQYSANSYKTFMNSTANVSLTEAYLDDDYFRAYLAGNRSMAIEPDEVLPVDKDHQFEGVVGGLWSPYGLVSTLPFHPGFNYSYYIAPDSVFAKPTVAKNPNAVLRQLMMQTYNKSLIYNDFRTLPSVHIVFTADTSKWTRCPVLEMCDDYTQAEGEARRFSMRRHASVDKLGRTKADLDAQGISYVAGSINDPEYISATGMGWFPGYAINTVSGERLNIMFGEDSRYVQHNGRDMMWNPTYGMVEGSDNYVMGGRHYIYVMNATSQFFPEIYVKNASDSRSSKNVKTYIRTPSYDAGAWAVKMLSSIERFMLRGPQGNNYRNAYGVTESENGPGEAQRDSISALFASVAWVNMPMVNPRYQFDNPIDIPCDVTVNIDVRTPYKRFMSENRTPTARVGEDMRNQNMPLYQFTISANDATLTGLASNNDAKQSYIDSILNAINVVPNPYYSYSNYETLSQLETKVRITNLPTGVENGQLAGCVINIYTVDGTLVRTIGPTPVNSTTIDWDLHNASGIPIAGGMYLIHVKVPGIGERVIKWFGTMRPVDLNSFQF